MLLDLSITNSTLAALKLASTEVTPHSSRPSKRSQPETLGPSTWPAAPPASPPLLALPPLPTLRSTEAMPPVPPIAFSPALESSLPLHAPVRTSRSVENPIQETRLITLMG